MFDWQQVAVQVPGMAVLAAIVWFFLRHVRASGNDFRETLDDQHDLVSSCVERLCETHEKTVGALDRNTEMFGRVESRLDQLTFIESKRNESGGV